ncbi:YdbL family protein [Spartinivicinus poritis]|uniref:YdbL family protein n=1 Tax=Spartinivicinus poritis TaxID=2994640 RepID=A0ABT5U9M9_9GAMM|nr:YdbL family protein [Spartinivicinus sp. A2-2]MDE1463060.1 YdbL family protein [Spartinivicinus sp. A2-2]
MDKIKIKQPLLLCTLLAVLFSPFSWSLDLKEAKQQGLIGEQQNGYLGLIKSHPEAQQIVRQINAKRKAKYKQLATQNGISLEAVSQLAGQKAIAKTPTGQYVQSTNGKWIKK